MNMIERVARAIRPRVWARLDSGEISDDANDARYRSLEQARAAIEAMREPTDKMVRSAYECRDPGFCDEPGETQSPEECWEAMIDAALSESCQTGEK